MKSDPLLHDLQRRVWRFNRFILALLGLVIMATCGAPIVLLAAIPLFKRYRRPPQRWLTTS